jgi:hypothetical protein
MDVLFPWERQLVKSMGLAKQFAFSVKSLYENNDQQSAFCPDQGLAEGFCQSRVG